MIDFHCHLDLYPKPPVVARECSARGVRVLSVTTTPSAYEGTAALGRGHPLITTAVGLHPELAREREGELELFDKFVQATEFVGEVGLDGCTTDPHTQDAQRRVFTHILLASQRAGGRILSVHSRRASAQTLDMVRSYAEAGTFVLHWFSGSHRELERALSLGCWFSIGPAMLRGVRGREIARRIPRDRILTESDGPFAQAAQRPLSPWDVELAVAALGEIWALPIAECQSIIDGNLSRLLALGQ